MVERYYISAVYEKDGKTPKTSAQHILGNSGRIGFLQENSPMWFEWDDGEYIGTSMRTSTVEKIERTDDDIVVYTKNSVYKLTIV